MRYPASGELLQVVVSDVKIGRLGNIVTSYLEIDWCEFCWDWFLKCYVVYTKLAKSHALRVQTVFSQIDVDFLRNSLKTMYKQSGDSILKSLSNSRKVHGIRIAFSRNTVIFWLFRKYFKWANHLKCWFLEFLFRDFSNTGPYPSKWICFKYIAKFFGSPPSPPPPEFLK